MPSVSYPVFVFGRRSALRLAALCLSGLMAAAAPAAAEAACVAVALNGKGQQIRGTRSITHGIFPRNVCRRALRHCERRLDEIRYDSGRRRPHAHCEIIASGPRAADIFGPPLEGWRVAPGERPHPRYGAEHDDDPGYAYRDDRDPRGRYDGGAEDELGQPGGHDGWRSAERNDRFDERYGDDRYDRYDDRSPDDDRALQDDRSLQDERGRYDDPRPPNDGDYAGRDPLIDDLLRDEDADAGGDYTPYDDGRAASGCNVDACAARYRTFRASDCSYKPTQYERRRCPL